MRDLVAGIIAVGLLLFAASMATTLTVARRRRRRARDAERAKGRRVITEIPGGPDLVLFSEDADAFYYGALVIPKASVTSVRVLINGAPIAEVVSRTRPAGATGRARGFDDRPEGIA